MMRNKAGFVLAILDLSLMLLGYILALLLRFDGEIPAQQFNALLGVLPYVLAVKIVLLIIFKLYKTLWRYVSIYEVVRILAATSVANLLAYLVVRILQAPIPRSVYPIVFVTDLAFLSGIRFLIRLYKGRGLDCDSAGKKRIMIAGAGEAGNMVLRELQRNKHLGYEPVCFIDDDPSKKGFLVSGLSVIGGIEEMESAIQKYNIDELIVAMPSVSHSIKKKYIDLASKTNVTVKTIPGVYEIIGGRVELSQIRNIQIEDLLGREEVKLDETSIDDFIRDKVVLISGGGGSIGSELARQIVKYGPSELVLLDIYENNLYDLQIELLSKNPGLNLHCLIESVRNESRIENVMKKYRPQIVFHAAAHKHVPLMEASPHSAILNNVFGTYNMARISHDVAVERFVFISTDKAVNPTNVMGTTKRLGEMIIQAWNQYSETEYVAVRFGNVLGSSGSVIPLFRKQIENGGPVTVTDSEINRYFMTIPEAAKLVLQAGSFAAGGEIFILDMGEPIKIYDLAKDMVRLSGLELGRDIDIVFTGLRPGEKLYEELLLDKNRATKTDHEKIFIESEESIGLDELEEKLRVLWNLSKGKTDEGLIRELRRIVPSYTPNRKDEEVQGARQN